MLLLDSAMTTATHTPLPPMDAVRGALGLTSSHSVAVGCCGVPVRSRASFTGFPPSALHLPSCSDESQGVRHCTVSLGPKCQQPRVKSSRPRMHLNRPDRARALALHGEAT